MGWNGWPFTRVVILFTSLAFFLVFIQVTLMHYRQNFRHWSQWVPVIELPLLGLNALILTFYNIDLVRWSLMILTIIGIIGGMIGFYMHFSGVGKRVDGYRLNNFLIGPPIILPLLITAMSALALLALYWS